LTLARTLPRLDARRQYVLVSPNGPVAGAADAAGNALPVIAGSGPFWRDLGLVDELERWGTEVYHSPLFVCPLVKACKYIVTLHDVIPLAAPEHCQPEFQRFFEQMAYPCLSLADRVVTVSEFSRRDILRHLSLPEEKVVVVPECAGAEFRPAREGESFERVLGQCGVERPFVLYVGSIERRKNVDGLLAAYAKLPPALRARLLLVIVGRDQTAGLSVAELTKKFGIAENVVLAGYLPDDDLAVLYRAARMFVFPSRYEGFGLPVLEAMASGVPVITSNVTSLPEVAGDAATLVDPDDADGLAAAMQQLHEDEALRAGLIERGLRRAVEFSPEAMTKRMTAVYDSLRECRDADSD